MTNPKDQMQFEYFGGFQRSPEWFALRLGKITASRLPDWLAVSKAKTGAGKPLKARLDYEKELLFERTFGTSFDRFVTPAMQNGIDFEEFACLQFAKVTGVQVQECGAWHSPIFVASPDRVTDDNGLLEAKVLGDNSFADVLESGVPEKYWQQIQGQLWASKKPHCYFVAINLNTRKIVVIKVEPDEEFHDWLELIVPEPITAELVVSDNVFDFVDALPEGSDAPTLITPANNGGW